MKNYKPQTDSPLTGSTIGSTSASGTLSAKNAQKTTWSLAEEVPLVLYYNGEQFGVMMVTPVSIEDFAVGFSLTEGIVGAASEITQVRIQETSDGLLANVIVPDAALDGLQTRKRLIAGTASCGLCGAQSLEAALPVPPRATGFVPTRDAVARAFSLLPAHQNLNQENRSCHAAALCDPSGDIILIREDVGRHNALDKLCGAMAYSGRSSADGFLLLSSRFSVEMAQKMAVMKFGFVASISAPTGLALRIASRAGAIVATLADDEIMIFDPTDN